MPGNQDVKVRLDHILEDSLYCLYKGDFNVSKEVLVGTLTTDLGSDNSSLNFYSKCQ